MSASRIQATKPRLRLPWLLMLCGFLGVAGFYLWTEHRAHLLGALPYLLFLLCPLIHVLGHRGHHGHGGHGGSSEHRHGTERGEEEESKGEAP